MRILALVVTSLLLFSPLTFAAPDDSVQALIERAETARLDQQAVFFMQVAERQLLVADDLFKKGNALAAREALGDVVTYSQRAHDASIECGKRLKNTEISLRKMAVKLRDIQRVIDFENQAQVKTAAEQLESLRTTLLTSMFGKSDR